MDKKDLLFKLNSIQKHNEIVRLRRKVEMMEEENQEFKTNYLDAATNYKEKVKDSVGELNQKIESLETEKDQLSKENEYYKTIISKIPNFIVRLFNGKNYKQLSGDNNGNR